MHRYSIFLVSGDGAPEHAGGPDQVNPATCSYAHHPLSAREVPLLPARIRMNVLPSYLAAQSVVQARY